MKTIKQLADENNTSKTAIRRRITDDFKKKYTETDNKGVILITVEGAELIAEQIAEHRTATNRNTEAERTETALRSHQDEIKIAELKTEIDGLNKLIELMGEQKEKDEKTIEKLTSTMQEQAEALNADRKNRLAGKYTQLALPDGSAMTRGQHLKAVFTFKKKRGEGDG